MQYHNDAAQSRCAFFVMLSIYANGRRFYGIRARFKSDAEYLSWLGVSLIGASVNIYDFIRLSGRIHDRIGL